MELRVFLMKFSKKIMRIGCEFRLINCAFELDLIVVPIVVVALD